MAKISSSMEPPNEFQFIDPGGRPFRMISLEMEVDGPYHILARDLYSCGIVGSDSRLPWGRNPPPSHSNIAFFKADSSVSGGEIVFDRLVLSEKRHSDAMYFALKKIRNWEKDKKILNYNPNCGGHIHVDASGYGAYDLMRLISLFGYLEEPIFRLAGAGMQYGHRSLFKGYDDAHRGRSYSNPVYKGPFTDPVFSMRNLNRQERNTAINIIRYNEYGCGGSCPPLYIKPSAEYLQKIELKVEGELKSWKRVQESHNSHVSTARMEEERAYLMSHYANWPRDYKKCSCNSHGRTIEWRVWNSQGNPRILYAWIALVQAIHAYCWVPADIEAYERVESMEPLEWRRREFDPSDLPYLARAQERIEFIFNELPLSEEEKDTLVYTFMRTPYKIWGRQFFKRLAQSSYKPPNYFNSYIPTIRDLTITPNIPTIPSYVTDGSSSQYPDFPERTLTPYEETQRIMSPYEETLRQNPRVRFSTNPQDSALNSSRRIHLNNWTNADSTIRLWEPIEYREEE